METLELLKSILYQSPGLAVALGMMILFMKYLSKRQDFEKLMHDEHIDERRQARQAAFENAKAFRDFTTEIQKNMLEIHRNTESNNNLAHIITKSKISL